MIGPMPLIGTWLSILALFSTGPLATAANGELRWPPRSHDRPREPHCADSLPDGTRTILGIRLNTDPSNLFVDVLGPPPGHSAGDAHSGWNWHCWAAANGDGTVLVVGGGELVDEFEVLGREMPFPARSKCAKIEAGQTEARHGKRVAHRNVAD